MKLTNKEIAEASKKLALEELRYLIDRAQEMEDMEMLVEARKGYAAFMLPYHRQIRKCS